MTDPQTQPSGPVGFVGLGRMGRPMAEHIASRGFEVVVHDLLPDACKGFDRGNVSVSPKGVADRCPTVFSCVSTTEGYDEVALGPDGLGKGRLIKTYVHLGTTGVQHVQNLAKALNGLGIKTVDAPISGGVVGAVNGTLATMASGPAEALSVARPIIDCYSRVVFDFGRDPGTAQAVKVINNNISTTNLVAAIEGLTMGIKAGADPSQLCALIAAGTGSSLANDVIVNKHILNRAFDWGGALKIIRKDLLAWQELAGQIQSDCPINRAASEFFIDAINMLGLDEDITAVAKYIEQRERVLICSCTVREINYSSNEGEA